MHNDEAAKGRSALTPDEDLSVAGTQVADEELVVGHTTDSARGSSTPPVLTSQDEIEHQSRAQPTPVAAVIHTSNFVKRKTSQLLEVITSGSSTKVAKRGISPKLSALVDSYASSDIANAIQEEAIATRQDAVTGNTQSGPVSSELPDVISETTALRSRQRASWGTQFTILSGRAFKNLYRDPALLTAHYVSSIVIAREFIFKHHIALLNILLSSSALRWPLP
jgi:hypothetical protein